MHFYRKSQLTSFNPPIRMRYKEIEKRKVTPGRVIDIFAKHGTVISHEKAKKVLDLMYRLAKLSIKQLVTDIHGDNQNINPKT